MADVKVLETLKEERDKLQSELERVEAAISAYQGGTSGSSRRTTSRKSSTRKKSSRKRGGRKKGSTHSAATKRKISQAMKKRWAERKKEEG